MMRHRPDLCVSGRRREARPPFRRSGFSPPQAKRWQSNKRPETPHSGVSVGRQVDRPVSSATPQRMSRSETSTSSSPNAASTRSRTTTPGDDGRRAIGVQAGDLAALGQRQRREPLEDGAAAASADSTWPSTRPGRRARAEVDRRRTGSPCRPRRPPPRRAARTRAGRPPRASCPPSAASASSSSAVGGSACRWRSVWRTTPICVETWKRDLAARADDELGRAAADVDHQQRLPASARGDGRAEEGQPRLLVAGQRARVEAVALRARARRTRRRWRRRARPRSSPRRALAAVRLDRLARTARAPRTRAPAARRRARPVRVDALAEPRDDRARARPRSSGPSPTSAISRRVEFVPMSTTATRVSWPGAASARRRARRAGCRPPSSVICARVPDGRRADVRDDEQVRRLEQRVVGGQRLGVGDVERGAGDRAARSSARSQRGLVDDRRRARC